MGWHKQAGDDHESVYQKIANDMDKLIPSVITSIIKLHHSEGKDIKNLEISRSDVDDALHSLDDSDDHTSLWQYVDKHAEYSKKKEAMINKILTEQKTLLADALQKLESIVPIKPNPQQPPGGAPGMPPMGGGMPGMASADGFIKKSMNNQTNFAKYKKLSKKKTKYQLGSYILSENQLIGNVQIYDIIDTKTEESVGKIASQGANRKEVLSSVARKVVEG